LRIDSHQYFTEQHPPEHLQPILERNRFDGSIVIGELAAGPAPAFVKGVVRAIDCSQAGFEQRLDELQSDPLFRGVLVRCDGATPEGFKELARRDIPVDWETRPAQLAMLPRIVEAAPELRIVIDDLGRPSYGAALTDEWGRGMEEAAQFPLVYCKASNLIVHAPAPWKLADLQPFVRHALAVFGPRRVMFGSGWPGSLPAAGWKEALAAFTQSIGAQPMDVREELLGGTAARFYGLAQA
jgi:L-fuconolactonase